MRRVETNDEICNGHLQTFFQPMNQDDDEECDIWDCGKCYKCPFTVFNNNTRWLWLWL